MKLALILVTCTSLLPSGCATPYHSNSLLGGYTDTQLAPDVFRVTFRGNGYTAPERVQDFALLRASELAQQHGFRYFAIIDATNSTEVQSYTTPSTTQTNAYGTGTSQGNLYLNPYGANYSGTSNVNMSATTTYTPGQTYTFYKPRTGMLIQGFNSKPDGVFLFEAKFLHDSLTRKYKIKSAP